MAITNLDVLISGRGPNMKSTVAACEADEVQAEVALVLSQPVTSTFRCRRRLEAAHIS